MTLFKTKIILPVLAIIGLGSLRAQTTTLTINSPQAIAPYSARDKIVLSPVAPGAKIVANATTGSRLFIDKNVVAPINLTGNPYSGYSVNSVYTIDKNLPVGYIGGSGGFSNGQSGYSIPIPVAPGTAGMVPGVSISYNSSQAEGLAGIGWNISGISSISRVLPTAFQAGPGVLYPLNPITLTSSDRYALDGNLIFGQAPSYSTDQSRRLENDNFTDVRPINNYASFEAITKDGTVMEYGNTAVSKLMVINEAGTSVPLTYYISKITDKYGNYCTYDYYNQNGEVAIKEIKYTGNAAAGISPYNSIKFYYDQRQDQNVRYIKGNALTSSLILREVEVFCETQSTKKFITTYDFIDGKSYLSKITEYGADNSHLNPTVFAYEPSVISNPAVLDKVDVSTNQLPALADYKVADFNGDGKSDILAYTYSSVDPASGHRIYNGWQLYINQNNGTSYTMTDSYSGFFEAYSYWGIPNTFSPEADAATSINLNGDEKEDAIFLTNSGPNTTYTAKICTGTTFTNGYSFTVPIGTNVLFADMDGDKIPEGIAYDPNSTYIYIWNFSTGQFQYKYVGNAVYDPLYSNGTVGSIEIMQVIDYDGDGIQEILARINSKARVLELTQYNPNAPANASNFLLKVLAVDYLLPETGAYSYENLYADFNGDGLTDDLTRATVPSVQFPLSVPNKFFLRYGLSKENSGNTTFFSSTSPMASVIPGRNDITKKILFVDMNNDGKTDILTLEKNSGPTRIDAYVSYGTDLLNRIAIGSISGMSFPDVVNYTYYTGQSYPSDGNYIPEFSLGDFDGDGYTDIMFKNTNAGQRSIIYNHPLGTEGKLAKVTNGHDQTIKFNYKTLAKGGIYTKGSGSTYPYVDIQSPMKVVSSLESQDANGNFYSTDYTYTGAKIHQQGKGFLGFDTISVVNNLQQTKTVNAYELNTSYAQRAPVYSATYLLSNLSLATHETSNIYEYIFSNGIAWYNQSIGAGHYIRLLQTMHIDRVIGSMSVTDYLSYDAYHNLTHSKTQASGGLTTEIFNTMDASLYGNRYPCHVQSIKVDVTRTGQSTISKLNSYAYYSNGLLQTAIENDGEACSNTTDYIYNAVGLTAFITSSSQNNTPRVSKFEYDAKMRFVTQSRNPLIHYATATYDPRFGVPLQTIDITNLSTTYTYDGYGRGLSVTTPDGNTSTHITKWYDSNDDVSGDPFPAANILTTTQSYAPNTPLSRNFYTAAGLHVKSITEGFNQNFVSNRTTYTNKGQVNVSKASYLIPCANPSQVLTSANSYDNLNRSTGNTVTDGSTSLNTTVVYSNIFGISYSSAVTTPDGKTKTTSTDPTGLVKSVTDNAGSLTYEYYSDGQLKSSALNGVTTYNLTYNDCGSIYSQDEPHNGMTTFDIDGFGQLRSKLNDGKTYTYNYDIMGRPTTYTGPEGTYAFSYITSGAGLENIETETAPNGTQYKYYYDALNRVYKTDEIVGSTYSSFIEYDQFSNPIKYTYPSGFATKMTYNNLGYPTTIKNAATNTPIWQADEINSFGSYNKFTLGNGIQTEDTYSSFGLLQNSSAGNVFDLSYNFNVTTGNLISQTDNIKTLTEAYTYDNLDRLTSSIVSNSFFIYGPLTVSYDAKGNITNKSDIGNYKYVPSKPNAVLKVENSSSVISPLQQDITYTAFEKALNIVEGDEQAVISYGPGQERVKTDFSNTVLGTSSTRYYLGNYEKEVKTGMTREVHYINAPTGLVAMHVIENGVANTYFTYSDHLGTPRTITSAGGSIVAEQNFDPWGQRRDPLSWDYGVSTPPPAWLFRGYTGHEMLPQFSLINMNGRMYDPQNARMLSADPVLHDATSSQAYNKYSYCINNPLKYTDPSGYDFSFSSKNADINFGFPFGGQGFNSPGLGYATASDVDLYNNLNGRGWSGLPDHQQAPGGGFHEASGNIVSNNTLILEGHRLYSKNHANDVIYMPVTDTKSETGVANEGDSKGIEAYAFGSSSDQMYKYLSDNSILSRLDDAMGSALFGSIENYNAIRKNSGDNNPYMFTNQELHDGAMVELEIVAMFVPVGEVFQGVKWAGRGIGAISRSRAFWSGTGSESRAILEGFKTLGQTRAGQNLAKLTANMIYKPGSLAYKMWGRLSAKFAQGASGEIHVFQNAVEGVSLESIWRVYEYPALLANPKVTNIIFHY